MKLLPFIPCPKCGEILSRKQYYYECENCGRSYGSNEVEKTEPLKEAREVSKS